LFFPIDVTEVNAILKKISFNFLFPRALAICKFVISSGMSKREITNELGNRKLNEIFYRIALTSVMPLGKNKALINPLFYDYYNKKISVGKTKHQALKSVQRRLVNTVYSVMKHQCLT